MSLNDGNMNGRNQTQNIVSLPGTLLATQHSPGHCKCPNGCLAPSWSLDALLGPPGALMAARPSLGPPGVLVFVWVTSTRRPSMLHDIVPFSGLSSVLFH